MTAPDEIRQVPPDGYADNPTEVDGLLQRLPVHITAQDIPNIAIQKKPDAIDDILSNGLMQMSLQDRNAISEEIHGVQTLAREETPEMLSESLAKMAAEIDSIPCKTAFDKSQQHPNTYVNSDDFRLKFLRCELFEEKNAASRMVNFLDMASELFGDFALRRQIQMSDFSREELQHFRVGHQQLLPYRDRTGRRIFASVGGFSVKVPLVTRVKILIYIIFVASEDVETQRKGLTSIIWPGTKQPEEDEVGNLKFNRILFMKRVFECLPVRTCSIHFSLSNTPFYQTARTLLILSMPQFVTRMKCHVGENIERQYSIKSYGIPVELIPLTDTGNIKITYLKQWTKLRRMVEVMQMTPEGRQNALSIIECPGSNDVVFRSGTSMSYHPGNVRFRCLVQSKHENPEILSQMTQAELAEQLIQEIKKRGGRFLKWDNRGYWLELHDRIQIHTKVSLAVRDFKYKSKAQSNRQTNQSYTSLFENQDGNKRRRTDEDTCCRRLWM